MRLLNIAAIFACVSLIMAAIGIINVGLSLSTIIALVTSVFVLLLWAVAHVGARWA